jgi:hypothetical protein
MLDLWKIVKEFRRGDFVQRIGFANNLSPFVGRVTAVHRGLGVVDVQFPYGNERSSADELIRIDPKMCMFLPPEFDQSYSSYDIEKSRRLWASTNSKTQWAGSKLPVGFYRDLAASWSKGLNEVAAYDVAWHRYASQGVNDDAIRNEVDLFYRVSERLSNLRIQQHIAKTAKAAAYWVAQNRQYRVSQIEAKSGKPNCPKCGSSMRRTTYKMAEGSRVRLFACPKDLFLIKTDSILGPTGEPIGW